MLSDHCLIGCNRYLKYPKDAHTSFQGSSYRKYTFEKAERYYNDIDKSGIFNMLDPNLILEVLKKIHDKLQLSFAP